MECIHATHAITLHWKQAADLRKRENLSLAANERREENERKTELWVIHISLQEGRQFKGKEKKPRSPQALLLQTTDKIDGGVETG